MTQMKLFSEWEYDEDTGSVMCRCPECGGRLTISHYAYVNPYNFCPYCGEKLEEGKLTAKRIEVYGNSEEVEERARKEIFASRRERYGKTKKTL